MSRTVVPVTVVTPSSAAYTTSLTGTQNDLVYTAKTPGPGGNSTQVAYIDPGGTTASLSVVVTGFLITVNLARAASAITSTGAQIMAAVSANRDAAALVTVALASANDGTGIVTALSAQSLAGGGFQTTPSSQVNGDATNKHYFTGNTETEMIEVISSDAGTQTVTLQYAPGAAGGIAAVAGSAESIPAGATRLLGPFPKSRFNQNAAGDVYFDPSVSTNLKFRVYRVTKAQ